VLLLLLAGAVGEPSSADIFPRIGDRQQLPLELPDFEPDSTAPGDILPPAPATAEETPRLREGGRTIFVRRIDVRGASVLEPDVVASITKPYAGRKLDFMDLQRLQDELTRAFIDRGYVTSGFLIPDQKMQDGVLIIQAVEGRLEGTQVTTDGRFRSRYISSRLEPGDETVNVFWLEERLRRLQQDPRIERISARLVPGDELGESVLDVEVEENSAYRAMVGFDNFRPPQVGAMEGTLFAAALNLTGWGDQLAGGYSESRGTREFYGSYNLPVTRWDTAVEFHFRQIDGDVTQSPFAGLDIESDSVTVGGGLSQPLYRSPHLELSAFAMVEWRRSRSYLFGQGFSFTQGPEAGVAEVLVLRGGLYAAYRTAKQVLALRTTLSRGIDAPGTTSQSGAIPDGRFLSWLNQVQYARRLPWLGAQLLVRGDLQLASLPLLPLEQFSIGGHATVRGYRENEVVRDDGVVGSIELQVPLYVSARRGMAISAGPFVDAGHGWDRHRAGGDARTNRTLVSVGGVIQGRLFTYFGFQLIYGRALYDRTSYPDSDLQDDGFQFRITAEYQ
jgi:hemolysin activation/secretion protein